MKKIHLFVIANTLTSVIAACTAIILVKQYHQDKARETLQTEQLQSCMAQPQEMLHNQEAMLDAALERLDAITDILARMEKAYKKGLGLWRFEYPGEQRDND